MHWSELDPGSQSVLRWTLASALIWGAAFAATSVAGALISRLKAAEKSPVRSKTPLMQSFRNCNRNYKISQRR